MLANVFVKFKLYDSEGSVVGNTIAHGQDIGPGENWKFRYQQQHLSLKRS
ncbi:FxLYD domain-containing protein [Pseudomonas chlororaphis]